MTNFGSTSLTTLAFALASAGIASPLAAQTGTETATDAADDNVIIVTAQKLEQSINDVPVTLTAQTGEDLEKLGISEIDELSLYVPGLFVQEQSANNPGFVIRGITSDSGSAQQAARVTLYYNGVDISRSRGSYQDLYDLERVEVHQGTTGHIVRHRGHHRSRQHHIGAAGAGIFGIGASGIWQF